MLPEGGARWPLTWDADDVIRVHDPELGWTLHFARSTDPSTYLISALTDRNGNRIVYHCAGDVPVAEYVRVAQIVAGSAARGAAPEQA